MLKLNDFLCLTDAELDNTKIRFHQYNGEENPIESFKVNPEFIIARESYWKEVLDTRKHGYNKN